jgi:NAD-dependent histone deacetylase SIR2
MTITLDFDVLKTDAQMRRTLSDLSLSVARCKKIVVVTGAGISCSCGIPVSFHDVLPASGIYITLQDFRSSDGLYNLVKQQYPDVVLKGRDLFDASLFRDPTSTSVFYTFISQLKQSIDAASPTPTHRFIKTLDSKKKLLRSYTQNIDGLEARAGLLGSSSQEAKSTIKGTSKIKSSHVRNVQLHGDIHRVRCMSCSAEYPCTAVHLKIFDDGIPPDCPECLSRGKWSAWLLAFGANLCLITAEARVARSARPTRVGSLRPAIVLYDEPHPLGEDIGSIQLCDIARKPDMLIVMGTSLKVHGLKKMVKEFAKVVHGQKSSHCNSKAKAWTGKVIFVNKTPPSVEWADIIDYHVVAETDMWVNKVIEDWKKMRPADWEVQQKLVVTSGDTTMTGALKHVKENITIRAGIKGQCASYILQRLLKHEQAPISLA